MFYRIFYRIFTQDSIEYFCKGDGERILRCWKFALLIFKAYNHSKYALASLLLQAEVIAMLTPRQAHCLKWNRTVNTQGGKGKHISGLEAGTFKQHRQRYIEKPWTKHPVSKMCCKMLFVGWTVRYIH